MMILDFLKKHCKLVILTMSFNLLVIMVLDAERKSCFIPLLLISFCILFLIMYIIYKTLAVKKISLGMELSILFALVLFIINSTMFYINPMDNYIYGEGCFIIFSSFVAIILVTLTLDLHGEIGS